MQSERGFTLIELLTVIAIIGVLASLSMSGFSLYKASAAYAVASQTLHGARNALEAALSDPDNPPAAVELDSQEAPGPIADPVARRLLLGMQLPRNVKLSYGYDPTCLDSACAYESYLQANHCSGKEFVRWIRFGDGVEIMLDHVRGDGCP